MVSSPYKAALHPPKSPTPTNAVTHEDGQAYQLDKWARLRRVLIIGADRGTYYVKKNVHAKDALVLVRECIAEDVGRVLRYAVEVSDSGLAPKNDHAIFVVATAAGYDYGNPEANKRYRQEAYDAALVICRTFTHLSMFIEFRGGIPGTGAKRFIQRWYTRQSTSGLAYGAIKYPQRNNWRQRDALILARPKPVTEDMSAVFGYIVTGEIGDLSPNITVQGRGALAMMSAVDNLKLLGQPQMIAEGSKSAVVKEAVSLITQYRLPREALPTTLLDEPNVWIALLANMPYWALLRNLNKMTAIGCFANPQQKERVIRMLEDGNAIKSSRVHPFTIMTALRQYGVGHGEKGNLAWRPDKDIMNALDRAFYLAFGNVEPTGKKMLLALDTSSSMTMEEALPGFNAREVAATVALITAATEPNAQLVGFTTQVEKWPTITAWRLDQVLDYMAHRPNGGTSCQAPINWARNNKAIYDAIVCYTDGETSDSAYSVVRTVDSYRRWANQDVKFVVAAMTASATSLTDPNDALSIGIAGFDSGVPAFISEFVKGI